MKWVSRWNRMDVDYWSFCHFSYLERTQCRNYGEFVVIDLFWGSCGHFPTLSLWVFLDLFCCRWHSDFIF